MSITYSGPVSVSVTAPVSATVYLVAHKLGRHGPHVAMVRTIIPGHEKPFSEVPVTHKGSFPRLYLLAAQAGLEALPEGSKVKLVCSDRYVTEYVFDRLDELLAGKRLSGGKAPKNADLFPSLAMARDRLTSFTTELASGNTRDNEHLEANAAILRYMNEGVVAENEGRPASDHVARKAEGVHTTWAEPTAERQTQAQQVEAEPVRVAQDNDDVPWAA